MKTNKNYKITVLSIDDKIEVKFHNQEVAADTLIKLKEVDKGFLAGILEEKTNGKWRIIWSLK